MVGNLIPAYGARAFGVRDAREPPARVLSKDLRCLG